MRRRENDFRPGRNGREPYAISAKNLDHSVNNGVGKREQKRFFNFSSPGDRRPHPQQAAEKPWFRVGQSLRNPAHSSICDSESVSDEEAMRKNRNDGAAARERRREEEEFEDEEFEDEEEVEDEEEEEKVSFDNRLRYNRDENRNRNEISNENLGEKRERFLQQQWLNTKPADNRRQADSSLVYARRIMAGDIEDFECDDKTMEKSGTQDSGGSDKKRAVQEKAPTAAPRRFAPQQQTPQQRDHTHQQQQREEKLFQRPHEKIRRASESSVENRMQTDWSPKNARSNTLGRQQQQQQKGARNEDDRSVTNSNFESAFNEDRWENQNEFHQAKHQPDLVNDHGYNAVDADGFQQGEKQQQQQQRPKSPKAANRNSMQMQGGHKQQPHQQQRPGKTLSFDQQAFDGRPALPLDAKKLQFSGPTKKQDGNEKKRRFPVADLTDGKKGKKVETVPETCRLHMLQWIENGTRRFLWHLGRRLTNVPTLTLVLPLIICTLATIGVIVRRDSLRMQTPFRTFYSQSENDYVQLISDYAETSPYTNAFNASNPRYDAFRRYGNGAEFAAILKSQEHSVLEEGFVDAYLRLRRKIEDVKIVGGQKIYKYSTLCRRVENDTCQKDVVDALMSSGKTVKFHYPETYVSEGKNGKKAKTSSGEKKQNANATKTLLFLGNTFGGVETDQDGALAKAESLAMFFKLRSPDVETEKVVNLKSSAQAAAKIAPAVAGLLKAWDEDFQRVMREEEVAHSRGKAGSVSWWSHGAFNSEVTSNFEQIFLYLSASLGVFAFGCLLASFKGDNYRSKPFLGLTAGVTIFLIIGGGWCCEIGISGYVNPAIFPAFFFAAATAMHLMINLLQSWRKYCMIAIDPGERTRVVLSWDAPCLLWCCMIAFVGYAISATVVTTPYFRSICQFMAGASFLSVFLILLLFVGVLYLGGRRELAGYKWYQCVRKISAEFPPPLIRRYHMRDVQLLQKKLRDENSQMLRTLGEFAGGIHMRYLAILVFCVYLIFAAWGCSLANVHMGEKEYLRPSTNLHRFVDDYSHYYGRYDNYVELIFHDTVDYFDARVRSTILDMFGWVETQEHVAERTVSWLKDFVEFEKSSVYLINRDTFVPVVDLIFLKDDAYKRYVSDVAFNKYREQILASRMYIELNQVGAQRQLDIIKTLTSRASEAGLAMSVRTPTVFLLQHDVQVVHTAISTLAVLIGVIAILTLVIFAQPYLSVLTVLTTCSVAVGAVGFTALWDVPLNAVNVGAVIAAVLHSTCLCITCCYQYGNSGDVTAVKRMAFTFQSWFPGAVWSSVIGLAAFGPLLLVECLMVQHLAKIMLCHFASILLHTCVFLPPALVVLTTSVPTCCRLVKRMCEESCVCCASEEEATSIYYIPTGGRPLDPIYVQQFYQLKFREDILPPPPVHPLPAPPTREMIMPPPPHHHGDSLIDMAPVHHSNRPCSPPPVFNGDSRMQSARSSMRSPDPMNPTAKLYRYGGTTDDFEDVMRARSARPPVDKRHSMSPDVSDPVHRSRRVTPENTEAATRTHHRSKTASPSEFRRQRHHSEEIYHEPSDPDTMSMQTSNTAEFAHSNKHATGNVTVDSSDDEAVRAATAKRHQQAGKALKPYDPRAAENALAGGPPKNKITYAKWSKEIPLDPFTTERVTAEKYTIEGEGGAIDLPPDWKRYWIKGNLRRQAVAGNAPPPPDVLGMVPPGDHHVPMHPPPMAMPRPAGVQHFGGPPPFHPQPPPMGERPPMMMRPPYVGAPPLPPGHPQGLPRAPFMRKPAPTAASHLRSQPAWMY